MKQNKRHYAQSDAPHRNGARTYLRKKPKTVENAHVKKHDVTPWLTNGVLYSIPAIAATLVYLNSLTAGFVYDDHRAILENPDALGETPISALWSHDFWGGPLSRKGSHGSWRPLTTLSFRLNAFVSRGFIPCRLASFSGSEDGLPPTESRTSSSSLSALESSAPSHISPFSFHAVNLLLHLSVTGAYLWVLRSTGITRGLCLMTALLFAVHPVHVEAVANVTGRAELLAALGFCMALGAYIIYLRSRPCWKKYESSPCSCHYGEVGKYHSGDQKEGTSSRTCGNAWLILSVIFCMAGIMCKEQAVTALAVGVTFHAAVTLMTTPKSESSLKLLLQELWPGCLGTLLVLWARLLMSPTAPTFTPSDNPAAYAPSSFTRVLSVCHAWAFHLKLLLFPRTLSFDWSMGAIPLVTSILDFSNVESLLLLFLIAYLTLLTFMNLQRSRSRASSSSVLCNDALNNNTIGGTCPLRHVTEEVWDTRPEYVALALALLVIPFLPASNLYTWVGFVVAERVLYTPSMGFCLLVAVGFHKLWNTLDGAEFQRILRIKSYSDPYSSAKKATSCSLQWKRGSKLFLLYLGTLLLTSFSLRTIRRNQDWQSDEALYTAGIAVNPPKALSNLGVAYSEQGRLQDAEQAYRRALEYAPNMADTHYNLGLILASTGRTEASVESFHRALFYRPWLAQAHLSLAATYQTLGEEAKAINVLATCSLITNAPAKHGFGHQCAVTTCQLRLARAYLVGGNPQQALDELTRAIRSAPPGYSLHRLHSLAAEAYIELGEHKEAREFLGRVLAEHPNNVPAHLTLSRLLKANGSRFGEAERWLRRAVALSPGDPHPYKHLGQLLLEEDRPEEASVVWMRAAGLDPADHTAAFNAATSLRMAGRNQHAEVFYKRAVAIQPKDVSSLRNLGAMLHLNGKLEEALRFYRKALALSPKDPQTLTNLQRLKMLISKRGKA